MPRSYKEYTTGLNATTFSVPFNFISIDDIGALGYDGSEYQTLTISDRSATNKTVTLSTAPSSYQTLRLFRSTTADQLVDFQSGSRLSESDLDTAYQQALFVAQEISEDANTSQFSGLLNAGLMGGTSLANFASEDLSSQVDGTETVFNISNFEILTTSTEAYRVTIDGIMQSPTDAYTLSANPARITFADPPPNNSKVIIVTAASAASSSTVDNQTIDLFVQNGQSKIRVKDKGIDSLQIATDAINHEKIEDRAVREEHLHPDLADGVGRAVDFTHSVANGNNNFVTSTGIYNAIQALDIGNLPLSALRSSVIRKASDGTAHGNETQVVTPKYVKLVADEVAGNSSARPNPTIIVFNFNGGIFSIGNTRAYLAKIGELYDSQNIVSITDGDYRFSLNAGKYLITMHHILRGGTDFDIKAARSNGSKIDFCIYTGGTISTYNNAPYLEIGTNYSNFNKIDDLSTNGSGGRHDDLGRSFDGHITATRMDVQNISSNTKYAYALEGFGGSYDVKSYARIEPID